MLILPLCRRVWLSAHRCVITLRYPDLPMGSTTLNHAIEALGYKGPFSTHGFRSTATTVLSLLSYPENCVDLQLAHIKKATPHARPMTTPDISALVESLCKIGQTFGMHLRRLKAWNRSQRNFWTDVEKTQCHVKCGGTGAVKFCS